MVCGSLAKEGIRDKSDLMMQKPIAVFACAETAPGLPQVWSQAPKE
jgi:hypothetical protein